MSCCLKFIGIPPCILTGDCVRQAFHIGSKESLHVPALERVAIHTIANDASRNRASQPKRPGHAMPTVAAADFHVWSPGHLPDHWHSIHGVAEYTEPALIELNVGGELWKRSIEPARLGTIPTSP